MNSDGYRYFCMVRIYLFYFLLKPGLQKVFFGVGVLMNVDECFLRI